MSKLDFHGGRKEENEEEKKSAVLEATLAKLNSSWDEFELGLGTGWPKIVPKYDVLKDTPDR